LRGGHAPRQHGSGAAGTGAEMRGGLTGTGASGLAAAIDAVRVGAASWTDDLVLRQSWTRTLAASATRSITGTMSVDLMVMAVVDLAERILTMCFARIEMDDPSRKRLDSRRTRAGEIAP
jgi:hypothetical protein